MDAEERRDPYVVLFVLDTYIYMFCLPDAEYYMALVNSLLAALSPFHHHGGLDALVPSPDGLSERRSTRPEAPDFAPYTGSMRAAAGPRRCSRQPGCLPRAVPPASAVGGRPYTRAGPATDGYGIGEGGPLEVGVEALWAGAPRDRRPGAPSLPLPPLPHPPPPSMSLRPLSPPSSPVLAWRRSIGVARGCRGRRRGKSAGGGEAAGLVIAMPSTRGPRRRSRSSALSAAWQGCAAP